MDSSFLECGAWAHSRFNTRFRLLIPSNSQTIAGLQSHVQPQRGRQLGRNHERGNEGAAIAPRDEEFRRRRVDDPSAERARDESMLDPIDRATAITEPAGSNPSSGHLNGDPNQIPLSRTDNSVGLRCSVVTFQHPSGHLTINNQLNNSHVATRIRSRLLIALESNTTAPIKDYPPPLMIRYST
jgi:hypothetical protein